MTRNPRRRSRSFSVLCAFPLFFASGRPWAVQPATIDESKAPISVDVRLVVLIASVRNKNGGTAFGLQKRNSRVDEDGQPQGIRMFHMDDVPAAIGLVVAAAAAFARTSNPDDDMCIVEFH